MNTEFHTCYFCEIGYPYPSCFISNHNGLWICENCSEFVLYIVYNNNKTSECPICYEIKNEAKLPCGHKLCVDCCKQIYFGSTTSQRPIQQNEMILELPDYPYDLNDDDDNDPERIKYDEYCDFQMKYSNLLYDYEKTYDELIENRDSLIPQRPEWMNSEIFINYENNDLKYHTDCIKLHREWEEYNETKTKGNGICPLCRAKP